MFGVLFAYNKTTRQLGYSITRQTVIETSLTTFFDQFFCFWCGVLDLKMSKLKKSSTNHNNGTTVQFGSKPIIDSRK